MKKQKTKAPATVDLEDSIAKNVFGDTISKFSKFKKHAVHIGTNDLFTNKDSNEIAKNIRELGWISHGVMRF